ncbi:DedA family protein [Arcobacter porcinus]|uniref:DedA family membrane protein, type I (SNARE domain) n=1 Tax=Arcobacter porcinus TaxID=1935204 RepID=A0A5C2HGE9_9BACT|nr:DedA family protein [Arcobacter porcinus]OCL86285.1 Inner membrane protein YohD [Aliarcobacter thereius]OCL87419.1 Inner membrane protein YohD [Arcobacter porcinus]QEP40391.1 DedA family membrane protein, type I (SNARE domain) [Arcobacter porcinus]
MKKLFRKIQPYTGKIFAVSLVVFIAFLVYSLYQAPGVGIEDKFINLLKTYGYIILFVWSMLEGEMGLIMAGLMAHEGAMNLFIAIFVAGLGGFAGDQVYFYIGRFNKKAVLKKLISQRRKFAFAHLLLKKHGWPIIFTQRYMYGMRTIIPMSIGITRYDARKFAFINLISAWAWASITILPVWYFGNEIMVVLHWAKEHWYMAIPIAILFGGGIIYMFNKATRKIERKVMDEN